MGERIFGKERERGKRGGGEGGRGRGGKRKVLEYGRIKDKWKE